MNVKKWIFLGFFLLVLIVAFVQRDILRTVYLSGNAVDFSRFKKESGEGSRIFIVGSEATLDAKIIEGLSDICPKVSISTKVNRFTNFDWQEKNELHRFIREGEYDLVLIETASIDFSKGNKDRIARFESSARKANSKLIYWSPASPKNYPSNFLKDLPKNMNQICNLLSKK